MKGFNSPLIPSNKRFAQRLVYTNVEPVRKALFCEAELPRIRHLPLEPFLGNLTFDISSSKHLRRTFRRNLQSNEHSWIKGGSTFTVIEARALLKFFSLNLTSDSVLRDSRGGPLVS